MSEKKGVMPVPKIVNYEKKQQEIMREAVKVFIRKGYYETNLSDIAAECGMGRTTLYEYFKNKDEIFDYAIKYVTQMLRDDYKAILKQPDVSFLDKIKMVIAKSVLENENKRNMMIMVVDLWMRLRRENSDIADRITERTSELRQVFKYLIEEGVKANEIKCTNPQCMAFTLYTLVETFILQLSLARNITLEEHLQSINALLDGLKA